MMNLDLNNHTEYIVACCNAISDLAVQKEKLNDQYQSGIISLVDATQEMEMIKVKDLKIKKQLVDTVHVKSNGKLRSIVSHGPTSSYPEGYVYTKLEGGRLIKAKDLDSLYCRLYDHYFGLSSDQSVKIIFQKALDEKKREENIKEETYDRYIRDFHYYITADLSASDIRQLTYHDLRAYSQDLVHRLSITEKSFVKYKTLLNLIFHYALSYSIIKDNPVIKINNKPYLTSCEIDTSNAEDKILTMEEIQRLIDEIDRRRNYKKWGDYYIYGFAIKFSVHTGTRVAEICSLKWSDISFQDRLIHVHSQQLKRTVNGKTELYYVSYTKDERGKPGGGRYFPLTDALYLLLGELQQKQKDLGITSEYVFCKKDGTWMNKIDFGKFFRRLCKSQGLTVTNNHALRMSLNSNVFIPNNISVADRAKLLGHSVNTNEKYYSYNQKDYAEKTRDILNKTGFANGAQGTNLCKGTFSDKKRNLFYPRI